MSQRELAALSGAPRSTIERAEAGRSRPDLATLECLLATLGYELVAVDRTGTPLQVDDDHDRIRDAAGRRLPAHLYWGRTLGAFEMWGDWDDAA